MTTERYLVSESWCPHCPAAKAAFIASGGKPANVISIAQARELGVTVTGIPYEFTLTPQPKPVAKQFTQPKQIPSDGRWPGLGERTPPVRYINWPGWGTIDLQTYNRNCNCSMCQQIRYKQQEYQRQLKEYNSTEYTPESIKASQEPTNESVVSELVEQMQLGPNDVVADLGSGGDARLVVGLVKRYRCRGIGVEIDPVAAERSRAVVRTAGLADVITIITVDALDFDFVKHRVTAVVAYLYPPLLEKLANKMRLCRIVATPFHAVPGLQMTQKNDVWIYHGV